MRLAELEHRKRKLEEAERTSEERLAAASKEATAKVSHPAVQWSSSLINLITLLCPCSFALQERCHVFWTLPEASVQESIDASWEQDCISRRGRWLVQAEEVLESAKREAEALRDSAAAAKAEAERRLDGLNAQQAETAQLHASLSAQSAAQLQREVNPTTHQDCQFPEAVVGARLRPLWAG